MKRAISTLLLALMTLLVASSVALADALVHVKVRGNGARDGRVTLTAVEGGQTYSCETRDLECRIDGVGGGRYRVSFRAQGGGAARQTNAMIPPTGTVTLFVSAGSSGR